MVFLIGLLTFVMVLDCLLLVLLVLIQLPKKEAGAGLAFGGSATDALFGAGSGTVLTKITKYAAGTFFVLALVLSIMQSRYHGGRARTFGEKLGQSGKASPGLAAPSPTPAPTAIPAPPTTGTNLLSTPAEDAKLPDVKTTNPPAIPTSPVPSQTPPK